MKSFAFWKPVVISLLALPVCLYLSVIATGGGHSFFVAKVLFPYAMLSTILFKSVTVVILLATIQAFFYGVILGIANAKNRFRLFAAVILIFHTLASAICLLFISDTLY